MYPVIFETDIFDLLSEPWSLHTYGLLIATGFLTAMMLSKKQAELEGEDPERVVDMAFYLLLSGLIGARIVFILTKFSDYMKNPMEIVMFWRGGLVFYGGFIGAALFMIYYCYRHKINFFKFADIYVPYLALGHVFGRLGCLAAGCCYGKPTEMLWGIQFPKGSMPHHGQYAQGLINYEEVALNIHPTQLYEAGAELLMFWFLIMLRPRKRFHGHIMLIWLALYPVIRSIIEMFRGDKERGVYILSTSQYISILVATVAIVLVFYFKKNRANITESH